MACSCNRPHLPLNLDVKYSFTFVDPESLELTLKSVFETSEKIICDCEGIFRIESDEFCVEKPILKRERDDDLLFSDGYSSSDGMWKSLSSCILKEIEKFKCKQNIEIYLEFRVLDYVTIKYR